MATRDNIHDYRDIIDLPHHVSNKHPQMPLMDRAAQFAPFAALTGHKVAIQETQRLTTKKKMLDENQKETIDRQLQIIIQKLKTRPLVKIVYFQQDLKKAGGKYLEITSRVIKIDEYSRRIILVDGQKIKIEDIYTIEIIK